MTSQLYPNILPTKTARLVKELQRDGAKLLNNFYLSGGTALSLQIGHRESEDLDFFSQHDFNPHQLQNALLEFGSLKQVELGEGTVNTFLNGVKLQFMEYPYRLLNPLTDWEGIQISSIGDIACTKLQTISQRGNKKDFVDLYFLLQKNSLKSLFKLMNKKYRKLNYSQTHIMKSLVYYTDADDQPMPRMHQPIKWEEVKSTITLAVKNTKFE